MAALDGAPDRRGLQDRVARIDGLLAELTALSNPAAQSLAEELVATVLELHREGLQTILVEIGSAAGGAALLERFDADDVVRNLLLLHDLHPTPLAVRVEAALDSVRPFMQSHKGGVELLGVDDGVVRLRLEGSCHGCSASMQTMREAVEKAVYAAAPDVRDIEVDGLAAPTPAAPAIDCLKPLPMAGAPRGAVLRAIPLQAADLADPPAQSAPAPHPSLVQRPVVAT